MKNIIVGLILSVNIYSQATIFITSGYGEGQYMVGDTVHIWANLSLINETFQFWSGDTSVLNDPLEWHSSFIMPDVDVQFIANIEQVELLSFDYEVIQGVNNPKNVYSIFPNDAIGTLFIFHGGGGSAENIINRIEPIHFIQDALFAGYNIVITESENATLSIPDSQNRWDLYNWTLETNVDVQNIQVIIDTLVNRGQLNPDQPIYSVGVSNGGNFSSVVAQALNWNGAVLFCSQGNPPELYDILDTPTMFNVGKYDPALGGGNWGAEMNYDKLVARNVPAEFHVLDKSPLYPQRFMRIPNIDSTLSFDIYQEFMVNGIIDSNDYFQYLDDEIGPIILQNQNNFPTIMGLSIELRNHIFDQVKVMTADHSFFSDYNKRVLHFLNNHSQSLFTDNHIISNNFTLLSAYPNPFNSMVTIRYSVEIFGEVSVQVYDITGRLVETLVDGIIQPGNHGIKWDASNQSSGIYFVIFENGNSSLTQKLILLK